jgi:hypothetical protein
LGLVPKITGRFAPKDGTGYHGHIPPDNVGSHAQNDDPEAAFRFKGTIIKSEDGTFYGCDGGAIKNLISKKVLKASVYN